FGRAMKDIHAEEPGECGEIGDGHCRSSAAVDVLIAWPVSGARKLSNASIIANAFGCEDRCARPGRAMLSLRLDAVGHAKLKWNSTALLVRKSPALVAQLDRAPDFESGGRGFESLRARQRPAERR